MSSWQERYGHKIIAPEEAARLVKSGDRVDFAYFPGHPSATPLALVTRRHELRDVVVYADLFPVPLEWDRIGEEHHVRCYTGFLLPTNRAAYEEGLMSFVPGSLVSIGKRDEGGRNGSTGPDVYFFRVSPPDGRGLCSFGSAIWHNKGLAKKAKLKVAEVQEGIIRTYGDNFIHVDEIDYLVELPPAKIPQPMAEASGEKLELLEVIGAQAAELVRDGDTLEIGIGFASSVVVRFLGNKLHLGFHSELTPPGLADLVDAGVIDGKKKTLNPGKAVATCGPLGPEAWRLHENPAWELYGVEYTHNLSVISAQENMVGINTAVAIDLTGQVAAESFGPRLWSGPGGQLEFVTGAMMARGGRSIHCLPSTARDGHESRIVAALPRGSIVTIPRTLVDYVVTEYGVVNLLGKSEGERAEALISIAHPDHRRELRRQGRRLGIL
ncbi:MAG: acetyl-CoA hydrolase/transferase C-terminal domain-containing protein [Dehalococcoidia bacterium]|nr:acetyl-CoA hydrolase/transferase C-terminal domain-containing protein [Dehalococcoidia bacterium]